MPPRKRATPPPHPEPERMNAATPQILPEITPPGEGDPLRDPALYLNRELSQLDFNFRVLAQALDPQVPLLERLRFLCISCTNLDEFFEIRAATVRHAMDFGLPAAADGMSPAMAMPWMNRSSPSCQGAVTSPCGMETKPASIRQVNKI